MRTKKIYLLLDSERYRRLYKEGFWIVLGQVLAMLGSLVGVGLLTGMMSPASFGQLALGMTVATLVGQVVIGPLGNGVTRFYAPAMEQNDLGGYFNSVRRMVLWSTGFIILIALIIVAGLFASEQEEWIPIMISAFIFAILSGCNSLLNGIQNAARLRSVAALHQGIESWARFLGAAGLMMLLGISSVFAMVGYCVASLLILLSQFYFFKKNIIGSHNVFSNQLKWQDSIWKYSLPFASWGLFTWAQLASDRWALQLYTTTKEVGLYSVLYQLGYLPMSMAKGLLPDNHDQSAAAARSYVLAEADVVMLVGARLNWLLSHGKGKTWGGKNAKAWGAQKFIQIDISPQEADSNVAIDAPLVGDIGSCVAGLLAAMGSSWSKPPADWIAAIEERKNKNLAKMSETLAKDPVPMNFHSALNVVRDIVKANPDAMLVNEGANALDFTRSIVDMYKPRKRLDVGTWGVMGIGMGFAVAAAVVSGEPVIAIEGDSAFGFSGMEVETICRYNLPVCVVVFNNNGVYRGTDVNPTGGPDVAPTVFVKGARYDKLMEAFGGVGVHATTPAELRVAMEQAIRSRKPTLINAVIDETAGTESGRITSLNPQSAKKK
jgi:hypothetical protein